MANVIATSFSTFNRRLLSGAAIALVVAGGLYVTHSSSAGQPAQPAAPAIPVVTQTLATQKVRVWSEFSGRLFPVDSAEIRPEVAGRITKVLFDDSQIVKAGDVLLIIDPRPYQAAVTKAEAALATARTNADFAVGDQKRAEGMIASQDIPQRTYDERANAVRVAQANVKSAEADLDRARLDLEHAYVRAPISGRVSRAELTVGNLVQITTGAPLLTTIVSNDAVYADFQIDEQTYMESVRTTANGRDQERQIPVRLTVQGEKEHVYRGTIHSFDNHIDVASGTIRARAKFDNADGALLPGMFVSVSMASGNEKEALLVPERAVSFDQSKKFVYVVGNDNKVAYREITLGKEAKGQRIVTDGLASGDRVIVDGVQRVRPDAIVNAKELLPVGNEVAATDDRDARTPR